MSVLSNLEPQLMWHYFEEITRVPRPSKHEEKIIEYLRAFATTNGLDHKVDAAGNVMITKPATTGMEDRPTVILQSHMDMVCEKNSDVVFDFMKDTIRLCIKDGWVCAEGTTLGADCGIGMAAAMAVLVATDVAHPAIEALFTVDEETGLTGAFELADDMLSGKYLINLDSEDEGEIFIGCAGGIDSLATFTYQPQSAPANYNYFTLSISGLKGGHSGDDIDKGLANSNKLSAHLLYELMERSTLVLADFNGGNLRNAIPREAKVVFGVPADSAADAKKHFENYAHDMCAVYSITEPNMKLELSAAPTPAVVLDETCCRGLVSALVGVANGPLAMSVAMPGMVETSTNLASVKFADGCKVVVTTSQRSSIEISKRLAAATVESVFAMAGADVVHSDGYPGWNPNPKSHLLDVTVSSYRKLFGTEPKVRSIHAGLECGLFLEKYPQLEMVSFGPTLRGVHSPDERLEISTVDKFWRLLIDTMQNI